MKGGTVMQATTAQVQAGAPGVSADGAGGPSPSALLALTEAHRAVVELVALKFSRRRLYQVAPEGDGHPVMVLPGFMGGDGYNLSLRRFLSRLGYPAHGWGMGRNLGPRDGAVLEALERRVDAMCEQYGAKISLVGHSLGGLFARELAHRLPDGIRQVITLGTPVKIVTTQDSLLARLFTALNPPEQAPLGQWRLHEVPPVPTTSIYSRGDGIVSWQTALQVDGHPQTQSIQVRGSHSGMTLNPFIWFLIAERLAVPAGRWQPFKRGSWHSLAYPRVS
ncbi:MAG: alpha/beta fold hydrolase [Halioglobus sp.]|nr:alpha/beta fold hydrolase [Halioglobus sp.]